MIDILYTQIDMSWFPFDEQECRLKFGSWTYDSERINFDISEGTKYSSSYAERNKVENGNNTFEDWYVKTIGYEKNGVSKAIFS